MINNKRYLFIGNRKFVLESMLEKKLNLVKIICLKNSQLEKDLIKKNIEYVIVSHENEALDIIKNTEFDILISNGCPFILPVSNIKKDCQLFLNIHPSYLPELRGLDPVPGAILLGKNSGATCHVMDDKIDHGPIISQIKIPIEGGLDAKILYQLSFIAEKHVFDMALEKKFEIKNSKEDKFNSSYYSKKENDLKLNLKDTNQKIINRVKAFNNKSQGAWLLHKGNKIICYDAKVLKNTYLSYTFKHSKINEIILICEDSIVLKRKSNFLWLKNLVGDLTHFQLGEII